MYFCVLESLKYVYCQAEAPLAFLWGKGGGIIIIIFCMPPPPRLHKIVD